MSKKSTQDKHRHQSLFNQITKRECIQFCQSLNLLGRCACGHKKEEHENPEQSISTSWSIAKSTKVGPTDAHGTIEFQGSLHALKANFIRLSFDTNPRIVGQMLEDVWELERPKMVISVQGGFDDFDLQPKLARAFQTGLIKAADTTGAWLIFSGLNLGVARHVTAALASSAGLHHRRKMVAIGIAPWGVVKNNREFVAAGPGANISYHPRAHWSKGRYSTLSEMQTHLLLADNGTRGRHGAELLLRRRLEEYLAQQRMFGDQARQVPMVCVLLGGGVVALRSILDYLCNEPPIPVVVCDGSGGAADLLALAYKLAIEIEKPPGQVEQTLKAAIRNYLGYNVSQTSTFFCELMLCIRQYNYLTIFRLGEDMQQDIDHAILTSLLKDQSLQPVDQLSLTLAWTRADIARSDVFIGGRDWAVNSLESAIMEALIHERIEFVDLLLENGVSMSSFLTVERLELLYNTPARNTVNILPFLMRNVVRRSWHHRRPVTIADIGTLTERLIGGAHQSAYNKPEFTKIDKTSRCVFARPFNDLLVWAVLTLRHSMALCMWQHGEDALAKGLVATRLYKACANEVAEYYLEEEVHQMLTDSAKDFARMSLELLEQCYRTDDVKTLQLLTYELKHWGKQTCLTLAVYARHQSFLAHPCCQVLLADLWHGGMRIRKNAAFLVMLSLAFPPAIFVVLDFKTKDELLLQAQKVGGDRSESEQKPHIRRMHLRKLNTKKVLTCMEKIKEFYSAPITTFWLWTVFYQFFLCAYTYMVLMKTEIEHPSWAEWYVITYIGTYACELVRRLILAEARGWRQKMILFAKNPWNVGAWFAAVMFSVAVALRFNRSTVAEARVLYACNVIFWYMRMLDILDINAVLGPKITMIGKMLGNTLYVVGFLLVTLVSFGIVRQSILFPDHTHWQWEILRNVTYKPYFMWYGEIYPDELDNCGGKEECVSGSWLATLAMTIYLLMSNIVLINLLIAIYDHIFTEIDAISTQLWKYKRYQKVLEYEQLPFMPPPLIVVHHISSLATYVFCRCCLKRKSEEFMDYTLKLLLKDDDIEDLLDFEEECMEDMTTQKQSAQHFSSNESLRRTADRTEFMSMKVDDILTNLSVHFTNLQGLYSKAKMVETLLYRKSVGGSISVDQQEDLTLDPFVTTDPSEGEAPTTRMTAGDDSTIEITSNIFSSYRHDCYRTVLDGLDLYD